MRRDTDVTHCECESGRSFGESSGWDNSCEDDGAEEIEVRQ